MGFKLRWREGVGFETRRQPGDVEYGRAVVLTGGELHVLDWNYSWEGSISAASVYRLEGWRLVRRSYFDGTDCDGRVSQYRAAVCTGLRVYRWAGRPRLVLRWSEYEQRQRDYAAEAMNY